MKYQRARAAIQWVFVVVFLLVLVALPFVVIKAPSIFAYFGADAANESVQSGTQRQALLLLFGGILAALTAVLSYLRHRRENAALEIDRDRHWTSRYTEAVKQLGDDSPTINYGGIYALQRLAFESTPYANPWMVLQLLSAHIREKSAEPRELHDQANGRLLEVDRTAVAALKALDSLSMNRLAPVDLTRTYLAKVDLRHGFLQGVNFSGAVLSGADLSLSRSQHCSFNDAVLVDADLSSADLTRASFVQADLRGASLEGVNLEGCDINGADLTGAAFQNAELKGVLNWTSQQLNSVQWNDATKWPEGFTIDPAPDDA